MGSVAPFLIFFAAAAIAGVTRGWLRSIVLLATPVVGAANLYLMPSGNLINADDPLYHPTVIADDLSDAFLDKSD